MKKDLKEWKSFCPQQSKADKSVYFDTYDILINTNKVTRIKEL